MGKVLDLWYKFKSSDNMLPRSGEVQPVSQDPEFEWFIKDLDQVVNELEEEIRLLKENVVDLRDIVWEMSQNG